MGQRTQILLVKKHKDGKQTAKLMHLQWGFGRQMYLALMDLFISDYFKSPFSRAYNYDTFLPKSVFDGRSWDCEVPDEVTAKLDLNDLSTVRDVFDYGDNNNGGLVIEMRENEKGYGNSDFKIAFLLGDEDSHTYDSETGEETLVEEAFARYLTPAEYGKMNGGSCYSDPQFVGIFDSFCDYFGIGRVGQTCDKFGPEPDKDEEK